MKIKELLEAPLTDYEPLGDFSKSGPFRHEVDRKLVTHPKNQLKAQKFFSNSPYDFRLFFSNISGTAKTYKETGAVHPDVIRGVFKEQADKIINNHEDAITVVFLGNYGDQRVMITPWIMAHRLGHAIQATRGKTYSEITKWREAEHSFFGNVNHILATVYGKRSGRYTNPDNSLNWELRSEYNALFNAIGTQRSSRTGQINRPYEFLYELFAQYIKDGKITLNTLPRSLGYGKKAWGRPTQYMSARTEKNEEVRAELAVELASEMEWRFDEVLGSCVGKIYLM